MGTTDAHLPCAISFLFMQFSAKLLLNNRLEFPLPRLASPLPLVKFRTMTTMKYIFVISDVVSNKFGTHSDDKNLWISQPYLGILEKFQCSLALAYIKIIVLYYFWVNCIDYLFMLQNIFSHRPPLYNCISFLKQNCVLFLHREEASTFTAMTHLKIFHKSSSWKDEWQLLELSMLDAIWLKLLKYRSQPEIHYV